MKQLLCLMFVVGVVFSGIAFALEPILIGDFEDPIVGDRYDNWMSDFDLTTAQAIGATLHAKALKLVDADGGWGSKLTMPFGEYGQTVETNPRAAAMVSVGASLAVDITAFEDEVTDYATVYLFSEGTTLGWGTIGTGQSIPLDGLSHKYVFYIPEDLQAGIPDAIAGWYCNIGFLFETGATSMTIYIDNIWIYPEGVGEKPYSPSVTQEFAANPEFVDLTLHWKAAADPNGIYAVNSDIVDEYIFMDNGSETDPNLYYLGNTNVAPDLFDPNSEYGPLYLPINSTYSWAVVEAMAGFEQAFTPNVDTLNDVDSENNIVGSTWHFNTLSTVPVITTQPVSVRYPVGGPSPTFTVLAESLSPVSYQWFYSKLDGDIDDPGDTEISAAIGGDTDTITISSANAAYQAYYYCRISNAATVTGGGTAPDLYSDVVTCVIERKVAEYLFDGDLNDTSGSGYNGTGVNSPGFAAGVDGGSALSLDGATQYVDLGDGDPNNNNNAFPRADLLDAGGIGGGLDVGTVMCWVKLDTIAAESAAAILSNQNLGWPATWFQFGIESGPAAAYTNLRTFVWGDADTGAVFWSTVNPPWEENFNMAGDAQWHMLATTWDMNGTVKTYVDGSLITEGDTGTANTFSAWANSMSIGASKAEPVTDYFDGLIDNLRVYNYEVAAEVIAQEYYDITSEPGCIDLSFEGSNFNADNTGASYCRIDLADFAVFAANWLNDGFYPE